MVSSADWHVYKNCIIIINLTTGMIYLGLFSVFLDYSMPFSMCSVRIVHNTLFVFSPRCFRTFQDFLIQISGHL